MRLTPCVTLCLAFLASLVAAALPALAETPFAVLDTGLVPAGPARAVYAGHFLVGNLPRAFAIASGGQYGGAWGAKSIEEARQRALENCATKGGTDCRIYAENLDVVWPGVVGGGHPAVPGALITGTGYAFVPDARFLWHGPQAARGIYVWSHGKGKTDSRGIQPQSHVRWFNNAGFDIVRFDRDVMWDDKDRAAGWLRDGLARLRQSGYRMVVAGGQSRGAWNSLQILDTPGLADVVIAVSPAAQGTDVGDIILRQGPALWHIAHDANAPHARVAFVQFLKDPYSDDQDERVEKIRDSLFTHVASGLIIDRPAGFAGHGAGGTDAFGQKYGQCLLRFALDPNPPSGC